LGHRQVSDGHSPQLVLPTSSSTSSTTTATTTTTTSHGLVRRYVRLPQVLRRPRPNPSCVLDETGWPISPRSPAKHPAAAAPSAALLPAESKREKKRRELNDRLVALNSEFLRSREQIFRNTLRQLQTELCALHDGVNQEYVDQVEKLEDIRDRELVQIEAGRGYALHRAEREYQDEMRKAEEEYIVTPPTPQTPCPRAPPSPLASG
jgi:Sds3-like